MHTLYIHASTHTTHLEQLLVGASIYILYSGYFSGGKIFVISEFLASSWKLFVVMVY